MDVWTGALCFLLLVTPLPKPASTVAAHPSAPPVPGELFSRRARHRAAVMLRLRWEELRMADLERVRAAIRRQLSIDELLKR